MRPRSAVMLPQETPDSHFPHLDPDGTRHGVFGVEHHGYFEAVSNHEARMVMGYYRLGKFDDARRSMQQLMKFAREFLLRTDLPPGRHPCGLSSGA